MRGSARGLQAAGNKDLTEDDEEQTLGRGRPLEIARGARCRSLKTGELQGKLIPRSRDRGPIEARHVLADRQRQVPHSAVARPRPH